MCWFEEYTVRNRFVRVKGKPIELRGYSFKKPDRKDNILEPHRFLKIQEKRHIVKTMLYQKNNKYRPIHLIYDFIL